VDEEVHRDKNGEADGMNLVYGDLLHSFVRNNL